MIKIKNANQPAYLTSAVVKATEVEIKAQIGNGDKGIKFPNHWSDTSKQNTIKDDLFKMHRGKCCYCERTRTKKREMDVEHYRPKAKVKNEDDHRGYWWLAYNWNNYLWSCKSCNQSYKINEFPLLPSGVRSETEGDDLQIENPCLINPRFEEPSEYLAYYKKKLGDRWFVRMIALPGLSEDKEERADETIRILGLNRQDVGDDLVSERGECLLASDFEEIAYGLKRAEYQVENTEELEAIVVFEGIIRRYREKLEHFVKPNKQFCGFFRHFLTDIGIDYSDLIEE